MFCLWEKFSQRVCHIQIRKYFANFYVNNALHGATLAYCSHFQYVSRSRLRVIQICVKTCIDVTFYDEPFCHLHNWEIFPYSTKDNFDHCPVFLAGIILVPSYQTYGKVYIRSGTQHGIHNRSYGWGIGDDTHIFFIFCRGRALSRAQFHTLQNRQEPFLGLIHFELLQNLIKVCALWKYS